MTKQKDDITTLKHLPVPLTDDELRQRGERLAKVLGLQDDLEAELSAVKDRHKAKMSDLDEESNLLARQLRTKTEDRSVEVVQLRNLEARRMETWRLDSRMLVEHRPLGPEEHEGQDWVKESILKEADTEAKIRLGLVEPDDEMRVEFDPETGEVAQPKPPKSPRRKPASSEPDQPDAV